MSEEKTQNPEEKTADTEAEGYRVIDESEYRGRAVSLSEWLRADAEDLISIYTDKKSLMPTIKTGWPNIDRELCGFAPGELIVVGGTASAGKTAFALNLAEQVAVHQGLPVAFFSFGETGKQITDKLICAASLLSITKLRNAFLSDEDLTNFAHGTHTLDGKPLWIEDASVLSMRQIRKKLEKLSETEGRIGLVIVDTLQDIRPRMVFDSRAQDLGEAVRDLKALAKDFNCPVVATAKLSRQHRQRVDQRVRLKALVIQGGEIPPPVKPNQQPVLSLGVEAVRSDLSVDKGVCEPQCESVKPISPVNYVMRRSRLFSESQTASSRSFWSGLLGLRRGRWAWRAYEG